MTSTERNPGRAQLHVSGRDTELQADLPREVSTGSLPNAERIATLMQQAHDQFAPLDDGAVADYIPSLGTADPALFGLAIVGVNGDSRAVGDADHLFSIQSISKAFVFALVCEALGHEQVWRAIGVNNTGLPFNSVMALELNGGRPMNPMVNAGALATTALAPGDTAVSRWAFIRDGLSAFAGRELEIDTAVYESEAAANHRNQAIARLLQSYGHLPGDPIEVTDVYTMQCSLLVSARDLAVMAATLADGGVNPVTGRRVVGEEVCADTLAVMATTGLYEMSGEWLFEVGMPGKSGVSGGIITIAPGKGGLATFSPRLDAAGNSVRGQSATRFLSKALGLNLFASRPVTEGRQD
ncbi:glutaminase A [Leifsonia sp. YIM 134122]|uniref:Glutaminase n=1 Tax=Leifsonia stereocauli TaxID=3134136 RepID=A0ABU9W0R2_9MICO